MVAAAVNQLRKALGWLFVSRTTGKVTVAQWPNLPLWLYIVGAAADRAFTPTGPGSWLLAWISRGALILWAAMEIGWGVNPFRRVLGGFVLAAGAVALARR